MIETLADPFVTIPYSSGDFFGHGFIEFLALVVVSGNDPLLIG